MPALTAVALLGVPAVAEASFLDTYQRLAERRLSPAPLVPTRIPKAFRPIDRPGPSWLTWEWVLAIGAAVIIAELVVAIVLLAS
jgi:hypothetical protein